jgi:mannose-6-phosphate isomerase-like protein (cupin superfamily)
MIVLSGQGSVDVGMEHTDIATGEMVVIPRNEQHVVHNPGEATLTWLALYWPLHEPVGEAPA